MLRHAATLNLRYFSSSVSPFPLFFRVVNWNSIQSPNQLAQAGELPIGQRKLT